jgi:hypothetical protein
LPGENFAKELLRRERQQFRFSPQNDDMIGSGGVEEFDAVGESGQRRSRRRRRIEDLERVRIERDRNDRPLDLLGPVSCRCDEDTMAAMHAIEIPDRHGSAGEPRRRLVSPRQ